MKMPHPEYDQNQHQTQNWDSNMHVIALNVSCLCSSCEMSTYPVDQSLN